MLHFALLGGALFLLAPRREDERAVTFSKGALGALRAAEAERHSAPSLTDEQAREVDARAIEDEVLYREALRLGLDRDDPNVRQRLVQKLLLLVEDLGGASKTPSEAELRAYFEETRARWRRPESARFSHAFARTRERLERGESDPFPSAREATMTRAEIERDFGADFASAVFSGGGAPVVSRWGWHRVTTLERFPERPATFEEARGELELDYLLVRRERITGAYLKKTVASYRVQIEGEPLRDFIPTRRVAARADDSAED